MPMVKDVAKLYDLKIKYIGSEIDSKKDNNDNKNNNIIKMNNIKTNRDNLKIGKYPNEKSPNKFIMESKSNRIKVENIMKKETKPKDPNKIKQLINKYPNNANVKNKKNQPFIRSGKSEKDVELQQNKQQEQSFGDNKEILFIEKMNNKNKNKFTNVEELNNQKGKENYVKHMRKSAQIGINNIKHPKIMTKVDNSELGTKKEIIKESSIYNSSSKNKPIDIIQNSNSSSNQKKNYYYHKKEAIMKKKQHQNMNNQINEINSNNKGSMNQNEENYLSDEEIVNEKNKGVSNKIFIPSKIRDGNKSTKNIKEFTLEKIPTQKLNNSFTIDKSKEHVKMFLDSNNNLNQKTNNEVVSENVKLQTLKEDTLKKKLKNENEMKNISYEVYQHVIKVYNGIKGDNKDITELTESLQKYMKQNLISKKNQDSESLYKTFKKSFFNYILCEIELNNVEKQIEKRKIMGKWNINLDKNNNLKDK